MCIIEFTIARIELPVNCCTSLLFLDDVALTFSASFSTRHFQTVEICINIIRENELKFFLFFFFCILSWFLSIYHLFFSNQFIYITFPFITCICARVSLKVRNLLLVLLLLLFAVACYCCWYFSRLMFDIYAI